MWPHQQLPRKLPPPVATASNPICEWQLTRISHYRRSCCSRHRQWVSAMLFPGSFWLVFGPGRQISPVAVFATPNRPQRQMESIPMAFHLPPQLPNGALKTTRTMILMICDVVRVCVRPVSPVTTHHELSSVSSTPQNMTPLLAKAIPPTLASDGFPSFAWLGEPWIRESNHWQNSTASIVGRPRHHG
jgi:hypothetical protein